ncbi:MAG: KamA family radical SAM protein [Myxococcales bacterium]|nr:KamA family radical SAM protein [Myxococcales bacterium]
MHAKPGLSASVLRHRKDLDRLPIAAAERARSQAAEQAYNVRAPSQYLQQIDWANARDPVRLQVVPQAEELSFDPREVDDPIGDQRHSPVPRLVHRYPDRVLLMPTYRCAVYCRHCFRKETVDDEDARFRLSSLEPALSYIAEHAEIREVIVTGGDPLVLSNAQLAQLRSRLDAIPHLRLLRVHTRLPVVQPSRVTAGLVRAFKGRLMVCIVTHFNHPREISEPTVVAARTLREAGFMLLNQTVLLRGINDDPQTLQTLFRELVYTLGIKPYYLHHCDLTKGLTHLRTTIDAGLAIMGRLRGHTSGVCLPQYVLDLPQGHGKTPLGPLFVESRSGFDWVFRSFRGESCPYTEVVAENPLKPVAEAASDGK